MLFDAIIVGGGLVGASLALRLAQAGLKLAVIEAHAPQASISSADWDSRIYALSPGSIEFLTACGAWAGVDADRAMRVEDMRIFGDDARSELDFSAYDSGLRELAVIVESRQVEFALWQAMRARPEIEICAPAKCESLVMNNDAATVELAGGRTLRARLVVGADGGDSWVRSAAGIPVEAKRYAQTAVVANFECARPHGGIAHQWFSRDGILALLPLPGGRVSMVWSTAEAHAAELLELSHDELAARVDAASGGLLGPMHVITPAASFPLRMQQVRNLIMPRLALVGDAAHNVHPLAGQGVNLGFADARALAGVLAARGEQSDCGDYFMLRRYERARREYIASMQLATDALQSLFSRDSAWLADARNFGLRLINRQLGLKNLLVHHAVG